jgi:hypothetical protein
MSNPQATKTTPGLLTPLPDENESRGMVAVLLARIYEGRQAEIELLDSVSSYTTNMHIEARRHHAKA